MPRCKAFIYCHILQHPICIKMYKSCELTDAPHSHIRAHVCDHAFVKYVLTRSSVSLEVFHA